MADKQTIGINFLITLGLVLAATVGPGFFDEPQYFCEARPDIGLKGCDNFTKYVADNGRCIINDGPNFICREGWLLVTNDLEIDLDKNISLVVGDDGIERQTYIVGVE